MHNMTDGYYYVKTKEASWKNSQWEIRKKVGYQLLDFDCEGVYETLEDFEQIGPRIPMPDEPFEAHYKFAGELGKLFEGDGL